MRLTRQTKKKQKNKLKQTSKKKEKKKKNAKGLWIDVLRKFKWKARQSMYSCAEVMLKNKFTI